MQEDIRLQYSEVLDQSHHGRPVVVQTVHSGQRGRPSIRIDHDFLRWAYSMRSTAAISRFLGVGRSTVRNALLEYGIAEGQENPFTNQPQEHQLDDNLLDPDHQIPISQQSNVNQFCSFIDY